MLQKVAFILVFVLECVSELMAAPIRLKEASDEKVADETSVHAKVSEITKRTSISLIQFVCPRHLKKVKKFRYALNPHIFRLFCRVIPRSWTQKLLVIFCSYLG